MNEMLITPVVSEKALAMSESEHTYAFWVPAKASKASIAGSIATRFKVKVESVNVVNVKGKPKRLVIKRGRKSLPGKRTDRRKAYVRLEQGQNIQLFEKAKK